MSKIKKARKQFVLDTNVLLTDPDCIDKFGIHDVIIPICAVKELDNFKKRVDDVGQNSRRVARRLDEMRKKGRLNKGVKTQGGGLLKIILSTSGRRDIFADSEVDSVILLTTLDLSNDCPDVETILVTKDINMRLRADGIGVIAEDYRAEYENAKIEKTISNLEQKVPSSVICDLHESKIATYKMKAGVNQYFKFVDEAADNKKVLVRHIGNNCFSKVDYNRTVSHVSANNDEQRLAYDALLDPDIQLVTIQGTAGTGKTLLSICAAIEGLVKGEFSSIAVTRPIIPIGNDLGFLPGDMEEKMRPWMQPIYDAIAMIGELASRKNKAFNFSADDIEIAPLNYMRGRSIAHTFMIIDEAQNISASEAKTLITRAGQGTKIVLTGDIDQIDNPYLNEYNNGFSYLVRKFADQKIHAHVVLTQGERSVLAEIASQIL